MTWEQCYATPMEAEAHLVKGFLEQYGVPCVLANERFGAQPLTFCALGQVRVLVPCDWIPVARGLIRGRQTRQRTTVRRDDGEVQT
jgi:hypothetical protein